MTGRGYVGRHRAPAPAGRGGARVAAVAVAALAGPVAFAPPAAAEGTVWDRVAECESSGRWDVNTGNGYSGGLQFLPSTWLGFGGAEFAPAAHLATPAEQVAVARRTLAVQGPGAWPVCSVRAGLTRANGAAEGTTAGASAVDPAPVDVPDPVTTGPAPYAAPRAADPEPPAGHATIRVRAGDTLSELAAARGVHQDAITGYRSGDPDLIFPNELLEVAG